MTAPSTGASSLVGTGAVNFLNRAGSAITEARSALYELTTYANSPVANIVPETINDNEFELNDLPTLNPPSYSFSIPDFSLNLPNLNEIDFTPIEDFTGIEPSRPQINIPDAPTVQNIPVPSDAPNIGTVTFPTAPAIPTISEPSLLNVAIPASPSLNIPDFTAIKPTLNGVTIPASDDFSWAESPYTSELLTKTVNLIDSFENGGVGIPDVIWDAIWARDSDKEAKQATKLIESINEQWANRGFSLPQGAQAQQIAEAQQTIFNSNSERSREIAIKQAEHEIDNLRFAVQQALAMEGLRGGFYQQMQERILRGYIFSAEFSINIVNAHVALFNSKVQLYGVEATVYKSLIEAELAKLEIFKTEIQAQELIVSVNEQTVKVYLARLEAVNQLIENYKAKVEAANLEVEGNKLQLEAYKTEVEAYGERIRAIATEYSLYTTQMEGAKLHNDIYASSVQAYAELVQTHKTKAGIKVEELNAQNSVNDMRLKRSTLELEHYKTKTEAVMKKLELESSEFDNEVKRFNAYLDEAKTILGSDIEEFKVRLQEAQQVNNISIEKAKTDISAYLSTVETIQENLKQIAAVNAAYAGSAMSAIHLGASMGDSSSNSYRETKDL